MLGLSTCLVESSVILCISVCFSHVVLAYYDNHICASFCTLVQQVNEASHVISLSLSFSHALVLSLSLRIPCLVAIVAEVARPLSPPPLLRHTAPPSSRSTESAWPGWPSSLAMPTRPCLPSLGWRVWWALYRGTTWPWVVSWVPWMEWSRVPPAWPRTPAPWPPIPQLPALHCPTASITGTNTSYFVNFTFWK